jgi:hypothetical protein
MLTQAENYSRFNWDNTVLHKAIVAGGGQAMHGHAASVFQSFAVVVRNLWSFEDLYENVTAA